MSKISQVDNTTNHSRVFVSMALDMSWRLAVVVLVPIIGGFELDKRLDTSPLLTIIGFIMAMGGMALVMWQTLQEANQVPVPSSKPPKSTKSAKPTKGSSKGRES